MKKSFYSHGKLLLTAEYLVLDGAEALAIPTKFGQHLYVTSLKGKQGLYWKSLTHNKTVWFEDVFTLNNKSFTSKNKDNDISKGLLLILNSALTLNPNFIIEENGYEIISELEFPQNWGLGSSSTLINNIAQWANIDPFELSNLTFGGSGYDIACAQKNSAILYQLKNKSPQISPIAYSPVFKGNLFFVHLNKKQNSRDGIKHYKSQNFDLKHTLSQINLITKELLKSSNLKTFCELIEEHERLISKITKQQKVKERYFSDFDGAIKSLGAWGGDFILVASKENPKDYFKAKGYETVLSWNEIILPTN